MYEFMSEAQIIGLLLFIWINLWVWIIIGELSKQKEEIKKLKEIKK